MMRLPLGRVLRLHADPSVIAGESALSPIGSQAEVYSPRAMDREVVSAVASGE